MTRLRSFLRDNRGTLSVEAAIMVPAIFLVYLAVFTFFHTFRADAANAKASYSVADMLSRETNKVNQAYVDGLNSVFAYMTRAREPTWIRVSSVVWHEDTKKCELRWSAASKGHLPLTDVTSIEARIPMMADGDTVNVVETFMPYTPAFNVGLDRMTFGNLVVTRPRFAPKLDWDAGSGGGAGA
jgi:hypothetical protein